MPWLTPDSIPADVAPLVLQVPDEETWRAAVRGAIYELTLESNWEEFGALTPEEVASRYLEMWEDMFMPFPVVGAIVMWPTNSAPNRWLICDGQAVDRATYADLFALIGTTYGAGNGSTTFNIPNLKGRFVVARDATNPRWDVLAETGGQESVSNTHTVNNGTTRTNRLLSTQGETLWDNSASTGIAKVYAPSGGAVTAYDIPKTMSSDTIVTIPPYFCLNFIICAIAS